MNNIRNYLNDPRIALVGIAFIFLFIGLRLAIVNDWFSTGSDASIKESKEIIETSVLLSKDKSLEKEIVYRHLSSDMFPKEVKNPFGNFKASALPVNKVSEGESSYPLILGMIIFDRFPIAIVDNITIKKGDVIHDKYDVVRVKSNEVVLWDNALGKEIRVRYPKSIATERNVVETNKVTKKKTFMNIELPDPLPSSY